MVYKDINFSCWGVWKLLIKILGKMKYLLVFLFVIATTVHAFAQGGLLRESLSLSSKILETNVEYSVYLPEGYEESNRRYPVLYLLHGYSDDETGWTQFGEVKNIVDRQMQSVETTPMIIVMPDAGVSWYINSHDGKVRYEDFFIEEFIPYIDDTYRTRAEKQFRGIAGLSMGGYGTLIMSMKHPDLFAAAAPLSAGVITDEEVIDMPDDNWKNVFGMPFGENLKGKDRLTDHYRQNSILNIINTGDAEALSGVRYYIDCGDDDFLIKGNMALHAALIDQEIPHEFRVRDGGHTWTYWRTALPEVLKFVSQSFHR